MICIAWSVVYYALLVVHCFMCVCCLLLFVIWCLVSLLFMRCECVRLTELLFDCWLLFSISACIDCFVVFDVYGLFFQLLFMVCCWQCVTCWLLVIVRCGPYVAFVVDGCWLLFVVCWE